MLELRDFERELLWLFAFELTNFALELEDLLDQLAVFTVQDADRLAKNLRVVNAVEIHEPGLTPGRAINKLHVGSTGILERKSLRCSSGGLIGSRPTVSLPSMNSASSLSVISVPPAFLRFHTGAKWPRSKRFASKHSPVPSKYRTFAR